MAKARSMAHRLSNLIKDCGMSVLMAVGIMGRITAMMIHGNNTSDRYTLMLKGNNWCVRKRHAVCRMTEKTIVMTKELVALKPMRRNK